MKLFDYFRREKKGLNPSSVRTIPISGVQTPLPLNFKLDNAYTSISAVYTVVSYLVEKFSAVPIRVYKVEDKAALKQFKAIQPDQFKRASNYIKAKKLSKKALSQDDENSDLARLLQKPNSGMSSDEFFKILFGFHLLKGEGFIWGNRGESQEGNINAPVLEMFPVPPSTMKLIPARDDVYGIANWVMQMPQNKPIPKEDILLWRIPRFDFDSTTHIHLRGLSPLIAGTSDLEGIAALDAAFKSIFENKGANGFLAAKMAESQDQVNQVIRTVNERINGSSNAGSIAGGAGEYAFFDFSMSVAEMQLIEAKKFSVTQVAQLYNAPAGIWDLSESANNNITQYRAQVYSDVIISKWCQLLNLLNSWLLPAFGMEGKYYIGADYSEIPDLQADLERMINSIKDAEEITMNEKREIRGFERIEEPLMDQVWIGGGKKPIADAALSLDDFPDDEIDNLNK